MNPTFPVFSTHTRQLPVILLFIFGGLLTSIAGVTATHAESRTERTNHFVVTYPAQDAARIPALLDVLDRAYEDLGATLGVYPPRPIPVTFYSGWSGDRSQTSDRALGSTDGTSISIRSAADRAVAATLVHELVHVFTYTIAGGLPRWFGEGVAVYFQRRLANGALRRPHGRRILAPFAADPYTSGAVAVEYMIDRYGMRRVLDLLKKVGDYSRDPYYAGADNFRPAFNYLFSMDAAAFEEEVRVADWHRHPREKPQPEATDNMRKEIQPGEIVSAVQHASVYSISP